MQELHDKAKEIANKIRDIHTSNIGTDPNFHEFTNIYKDFEVITHDIGEKLSAIGEPILEIDNEESRQEVYDMIESFKGELEDFIESDKPTKGTDNKLRTILDSVEDLCIKAKGFIVEMEQEEEEDKEPDEKEKPKDQYGIKLPK